jgi:hypothetical protein
MSSLTPAHATLALLTPSSSSFLSFVRDVSTFDERLQAYIATTYSQRQSVAHLRATPCKPCISTKINKFVDIRISWVAPLST